MASLWQSHSYAQLATDLIDAKFDGTSTRHHEMTDTAATPVEEASCGEETHLNPTVKRRRTSTNGPSFFLAQRDCRRCRAARITFVCWTCRDTPDEGEVFLCGPRTGRACFTSHLASVHLLRAWFTFACRGGRQGVAVLRGGRRGKVSVTG